MVCSLLSYSLFHSLYYASSNSFVTLPYTNNNFQVYYSLEHSYETVLQTPPEVTNDPKAAIIVPAFFHTGWTIANGTLEEQVASYVNSSFITIHHIINS